MLSKSSIGGGQDQSHFGGGANLSPVTARRPPSSSSSSGESGQYDFSFVIVVWFSFLPAVLAPHILARWIFTNNHRDDDDIRRHAAHNQAASERKLGRVPASLRCLLQISSPDEDEPDDYRLYEDGIELNNDDVDEVVSVPNPRRHSRNHRSRPNTTAAAAAAAATNEVDEIHVLSGPCNGSSSSSRGHFLQWPQPQSQSSSPFLPTPPPPPPRSAINISSLSLSGWNSIRQVRSSLPGFHFISFPVFFYCSLNFRTSLIATTAATSPVEALSIISGRATVYVDMQMETMMN